jgi:uncharacterized protein
MMAGPWEDQSGAMLVFSTDRGIIEQILSEDPYYSTPGVLVKYVREWLPIIGVTNSKPKREGRIDEPFRRRGPPA